MKGKCHMTVTTHQVVDSDDKLTPPKISGEIIQFSFQSNAQLGQHLIFNVKEMANNSVA